MVKKRHCAHRPDAATNRGEEQKGFLRHTPPSLFGAKLVPAINGNGNSVDDNEPYRRGSMQIVHNKFPSFPVEKSNCRNYYSFQYVAYQEQGGLRPLVDRDKSQLFA